MLKLRIISALIGIPILLSLVWAGHWFLVSGVALLAGLAWREFRDLAQAAGLQVFTLWGWLFVLILPLVAYLESRELFWGLSLQLYLGCLIGMAFIFIGVYPRRSLADMAATFWGIVYTGGLFSYWIWLRHLDEGFYWILLTFFLTWATDTGAYLVGRKWGRHRPWPQLSPNKTREGAYGGLLFCFVVSLLFSRFFPYWGGPSLSPPIAILLGLVVGSVAQAGDLVESGLKRLGGVKDSGTLIPGHGGILDRFDSLLFTVPVVYFLVKIFV